MLFFFFFQVKAYGPGLEKTGCIVNNPAEFYVDPKDTGTAPLKIFAQVNLKNRTSTMNMRLEMGDKDWSFMNSRQMN